MAKRFTDTGTWQDEWFMNLPPEYKLAYMFIKDNCDQAGVWKPNKKLADIMIGCEVDWDDFLIEAGERVKIVSSGYWWLTKFCDFQYGTLSENCKPHTKVIETLKKYNLLDRVTKGYTNTMYSVEDKEQYKEEEKEKDKDKEIEVRKQNFIALVEIIPDYSPLLKSAFLDYWTERSPGQKKMRFEKETAFDISRRLKTWLANESKFKKNDSTKNGFNGNKKGLSSTIPTNQGKPAGRL